ncbi:MAG: single-stranded-DNA-specific exonuclease RecJ, partial [Phycisphaerales bacterium]
MQTVAGKRTRNKPALMAVKTAAKQWNIKPLHSRVKSLARELKIAPIVAQALLNRGITDTSSGSSFLRPRLTELIAPEEMPGAPRAAERIAEAITNQQKVTVYGDYDADGITGASILWHLIKMLDGDVDYYIPHRIDEGYGLNDQAIRSIAESGTNLLITVDCGITAVDSVALANSLNLDVIITDHHQPGPELPKGCIIVHPVVDAGYPNQDSSGAMVAFKLTWSLANKFSSGPRLHSDLRQFMLDATSLAAIGTIADIVDLRAENRILTSYGLQSLAESKLPGIRALIETAGLTGKDLDSFDIGFRLAPMLNAAGRMGHARLAVELLTSESDMHCTRIAEYLKQQNELRRRHERKIFKQACQMINEAGLNHPHNKSIVLQNSDWHIGVIGIVASRIVDKYFRPTIMFSSGDSIAQGSGRSIPGFSLLDAISACSKHLEHFGGHKMAAGLTIRTENIEKFAADFETYTKENLKEHSHVATIDIDAEFALDQFSHESVKQLQLLGPFGQGNPRPVFATKGLKLISPPRRVGARSDHLQLAVTDNTASLRCIGFG